MVCRSSLVSFVSVVSGCGGGVAGFGDGSFVFGEKALVATAAGVCASFENRWIANAMRQTSMNMPDAAYITDLPRGDNFLLFLTLGFFCIIAGSSFFYNLW